jgi:hypothetical protein
MQYNDPEFLMSKYLDGTLSEAELTTFDAWLNENPEAQIMLAEYHRVDDLLRAAPLPAVRWDALALSISAAVHAAHEERQEQSPRIYRMPDWIRSIIPIALAASVLLATLMGIRVYLNHAGAKQLADSRIGIIPRHVAITPEASTLIAIGPGAEPIAGPTDVQISVGPSVAVQGEPTVVQYSDDVVTRPSSVTIASGMPVHQDAAELLLDME